MLSPEATWEIFSQETPDAIPAVADLGKAVMEKLALRASSVVGCCRQSAGCHLAADGVDGGENITAQLRREGDLVAPTGRAVPHVSVWNFEPEHLLQAQTLGAYLHVGRPPVPGARLALDGPNGALRDLHSVCSA